MKTEIKVKGLTYEFKGFFHPADFCLQPLRGGIVLDV
jgi:hypothetical protein